jgi:phage head-tail adaptor, putative, SPP1 family
MRAGLLKQIIEIQAKTIIKDEYGADVETYLPFLTTRCDVRYKTGTKQLSEMEIFNDQTLEFNIRYRSGIDETMRIKFNGRLYKIVFINEIEYRKSLQIVGERLQE